MQRVVKRRKQREDGRDRETGTNKLPFFGEMMREKYKGRERFVQRAMKPNSGSAYGQLRGNNWHQIRVIKGG